MLWGSALEFWDTFGIRLMFVGAGIGLLALLSSLASAYILYRVADVAQKTLESGVAKAQAEVARANESLAKATLETERLKREFSWRSLSEEESGKLVAALRGEGIQASVIWAGDDPERIEYAAQFIDAFRRAGVLGGAGGGGIINPPPAPGISVQSVDISQGNALVAALRSAGLNPLGPTSTGITVGGRTVLLIGPKPRPK